MAYWNHKIYAVLLLAFLVSSSLFAKTNLPYGEDFISFTNEIFFSNEQFDSNKYQEYKNEILQRRNEVAAIVANYHGKFKDKSAKKVRAEIAEEKLIFIYDLILIELDKLEKAKSFERKMALVNTIFELDYTAKSTGVETVVTRAIKRAEAFVKSDHHIKIEKTPLGEASNLYDTLTKKFYTQDELSELKSQGFDISTLDPDPKSGFWEDRSKLKDSFEEIYYGKSSMYEGVFLGFPTDEAKFKKVRKTQTKPKFDVTMKMTNPLSGKEEKRKFKLKFAAEMHSEVTAASLAANLGFHTDVSKYVQNFKVVLPKEVSLEDVKREWYSYFEKYDFDEYVKEFGVDDEGKTYLIFHDALIEAKPSELERLGSWGFGALNHKHLRELRGFYLFNIWVGNTDLKEEGNNKIVYKDLGQGKYKLYHYMHDLGFTFGHRFKESPMDFKWNMVDKITHRAIHLDFRDFQINSGFDHVSYADARWMIRKIAKLTREDIEKATILGGWPLEARLLLVEKLISRRNDLVQAFGLSDEIPSMSFDRYITTENRILNNGELTRTDFEGYSTHLGNELIPHINTLKGIMRKAFFQGRTMALGGVSDLSVDLNDIDIGISNALLVGVEFKPKRVIERNTSQTGNDDYFLVQDSLIVKYSLGLGLVVRGEVNYVQEYKMTFPVKTYEEGMYHQSILYNYFLRSKIKNADLPKNAIVSMADGFEGEGEIMLQSGATFGIRADIGIRKGAMTRTIIAKKDNKYLIYKDVDRYKEFYQELFATFFILKLPVFAHGNSWGTLNRNVYELTYDKGDEEDIIFKTGLISKFINTTDTSILEGHGSVANLESNYVMDRTKFNLFGLFSYENKERKDDITQTTVDGNGKIDESKFYQIDIENEYNRSPIFSREMKSKSVRFIGNIGDDDKITNGAIEIDLRIEDGETKSKELQRYIDTLNKLALDNEFINFTPELHSHNDIWNETIFDVKLIYNAKAIENLLNAKEDYFYEVMAKFSNKSARFWKSSRMEKNSISRKVDFLRKKYRFFVNRIKKAKKQKDVKKKYSQVVDAINRLIKRENDTFGTILMQRVHYIIGKENIYMEGKITVPSSTEMRFPAELPLYNVMNPHNYEDSSFFEFEFDHDHIKRTWDLFMKNIN